MKIENAHNGLKWLRVFLKDIILSQCFSNFSPRVPVTIHKIYAYDWVQEINANVQDTGILGCFAGCQFKPPNLPTIETTTL
jgi:hypothetical protein